LPTLFITSQVELQAPSPRAQPLAFAAGAFPEGKVSAEILPADGQKCPRCWTYSTAVGQGGDLCLKCREALG
jgi:isoleucyl-tRNA synthetase